MSLRLKYMRFVVLEKDEDSGKEKGIFQEAARLRDSGDLAPETEAYLRQLFEYFDSNLEKPRRFSRSSRPGRSPKAISWFKSTAKEHLDKAREIVSILNLQGISTRVEITSRPGYVVYEDEHQVTAVPFSQT